MKHSIVGMRPEGVDVTVTKAVAEQLQTAEAYEVHRQAIGLYEFFDVVEAVRHNEAAKLTARLERWRDKAIDLARAAGVNVEMDEAWVWLRPA